MDKEVLENYKIYLERKKLYQSFGYDVEKERDFILAQAKPLHGKILEAGTGKGNFALALAKAGYSFVTFDISAVEQRFAKLNIAHFGFQKQVDFRIENGEHTSFSEGSFDTVFSVNVLHHLRNPYQVFNELIRLLSQNGKLILADFTEEGLKIMDKIHALEGNKHEVGKTKLTDAEAYLREKCFLVRSIQSMYQHVLIASKDLNKINDHFNC
ncbi:MAG: class I SAM-dependent methyltransferase [Candidatus Omnitrophica bacterium]|nr:class I SAM-dependent methyltransferase [Candidatus Omnitrophota bacterium]